MHTRRLITFLLGAWFAILVSTAFLANVSLQVANNAAKAPPPESERAVQLIGEPMTGQMFRFVAAEFNRTLFETAGLFEVLLLLVLTLLLFLQNYSRTATILCAVVLLAALGSHFLLTPQLVAQGRLLDFRSMQEMLAERVRFGRLHLLFGAVSLFRLAGGMTVAFLFLRRGSRSRG